MKHEIISTVCEAIYNHQTKGIKINFKALKKMIIEGRDTQALTSEDVKKLSGMLLAEAI